MGSCFNKVKKDNVLSSYDPTNPQGIYIPSNALSFSMKPLEPMPMSDSIIMRTFKKMMRPKYYWRRLQAEEPY